jgi:ABC-2 type transport system ATP-binding protein
VDADRRLLSAPVTDRMAALAGVVRALGEAGIEAEDIALRRPTLDEVFLHLTGVHDRSEQQDRTGDHGRTAGRDRTEGRAA